MPPEVSLTLELIIFQLLMSSLRRLSKQNLSIWANHKSEFYLGTKMLK